MSLSKVMELCKWSKAAEVMAGSARFSTRGGVAVMVKATGSLGLGVWTQPPTYSSLGVQSRGSQGPGEKAGLWTPPPASHPTHTLIDLPIDPISLFTFY